MRTHNTQNMSSSIASPKVGAQTTMCCLGASPHKHTLWGSLSRRRELHVRPGTQCSPPLSAAPPSLVHNARPQSTIHAPPFQPPSIHPTVNLTAAGNGGLCTPQCMRSCPPPPTHSPKGSSCVWTRAEGHACTAHPLTHNPCSCTVVTVNRRSKAHVHTHAATPPPLVPQQQLIERVAWEEQQS